MLRRARVPLLFCAFFAPPVWAADLLPGPVPAELERVVDGDTIAVRAHVWLDQHVSVHVRLAGVDAPEIFRPGCAAERALGQRATDFVAAHAGGPLTLIEIEYGKYAGRVVARALTADGEDIGEMLIAAGLAAPDAERRDWCAGS